MDNFLYMSQNKNNVHHPEYEEIFYMCPGRRRLKTTDISKDQTNHRASLGIEI